MRVDLSCLLRREAVILIRRYEHIGEKARIQYVIRMAYGLGGFRLMVVLKWALKTDSVITLLISVVMDYNFHSLVIS